LLGALYAQINLEIAAIGGKDSMSGSFNDLDVPNTLISFAMGTGRASKVLTNVFLHPGKLVWLKVKRDSFNVPDFDYLKKLYKKINLETENCNILHATIVEEGGIAAAAVKSALGDGKGLEFYNFNEEYFKAYFGDILVVMKDETLFDDFEYEVVARVLDTPKFLIGDAVLKFDSAKAAFTSTLEDVFPSTAPADGIAKNTGISYTQKKSSEVRITKPRVFIPVFPGTNCEYDTARAFNRAGAKVETFVVKNQNEADIEEAVAAIVKCIEKAK
jgi:Phosphoribosylformylglycinamidine (FGAM) synthase, synthetase domain